MATRTVQDPLGEIRVRHEAQAVDEVVVDVDPVAAEATVVDLIRAGMSDGLRRLVEHEPVVRADDDPEGIHQARVGVRRVRSVLRAFRPVLDDEQLGPLDDELKQLGRLLGEVRDTDVLGARLHDALEALPSTADRRAGIALRAHLADQRAGQLRRVLDELSSDHHRVLVDRVLRVADHPPLAAGVDSHGPGAAAAPALVGRPWRKVRRRVGRLDDQPEAPSDDELHAVRIRAKRARYAADVVAPVVGSKAAALSKRLAGLQDVLGDLHDAVVFQQWLRAAGGDPTVPRAAAVVAGLLIAQQEDEATSLRATWRKQWRKALKAGRQWPAKAH